MVMSGCPLVAKEQTERPVLRIGDDALSLCNRQFTEEREKYKLSSVMVACIKFDNSKFEDFT